ncbi:MAG: hypothetical protein JWQ43_1477 [Glaciihabitans sp.]|nr:hypothetical protein [Glaciihabitans sp.]
MPADSSPHNIERDARRGAQLERLAAILFVASALTLAIVIGAVIVSGWFAGVLIDRWERLFWAGALLGGFMVVIFAAASMPVLVHSRPAMVRALWLIRIGLLCFVVAPALCIVALVGDFYQL